MTSLPAITLRKREERRILAGHLWVFSNEIASVEGDPPPGQLCELRSASGAFLGTGFYNRHSLIALRLLDRDRIPDVRALLARRLAEAEALRARLGYGQVYRLIHGEADFLPGLVVDRYGDSYVLSSYAAGADALLPLLAELLVERHAPTRVVENSDSPWRSLEGLTPRIGVLHGTGGRDEVEIDNLRFVIDFEKGQKTGMFLDQRDTRRFVESWARDCSVLDLCCNDGGFSLYARRGGARSVEAVDVSGRSLALARENADRNGGTSPRFVEADVFEYLESCVREGRTFDLVVVDPPAFVKNRKSLASGLMGYRRLNELALRASADGALLVTCSCSQHVQENDLLDVVHNSAHRAGVRFQILRLSGAGPDHPILPAMPETRYLTCVAGRVLR